MEEKDYKKLYEDVVALAKDGLKDGLYLSQSAKAVTEFLFPQLKETEDEKVRKELTTFLINFNNGAYSRPSEDKIDSWIKWIDKKASDIEKQCEQTAVDEVKPKFKVGDWIVQENIGTYKVIEICESWYEVLDNKDNHYSIGFDKEDMCHLWTIQDAKDGDVLVNKNREMPFIFKECKDNHIYCYCGYTNHKDIFFDRFVDREGEELHWLNLFYEQAYPATKEQRDLLFQKMYEAGYEWDSEKKELKKIERNHTDEVKPKFKVGDWIVYEGLGTYKVVEIHEGWYSVIDSDDRRWSVMFEKESLCHLWTIQDSKDGDVLATKKGNPFIYDKDRYNNGLAYYYAGLDVNKELTLKSPHHMLAHFGELCSIFPATKEQRDLLFQKMKEAGYEWNAEKKELNKIGQESTWNEKIKGLNELETYILSLVPDRSLDAIKVDAKNIRYIINKEQNPEPNKEWSKEDSERLLRIHQFIWANRKGDTDEIYQQEQDADWLMSIIPQQNQYDKGYNDGYSAAKYNQWKPTDKQMEDFRMLLDYNIGVFDYAKFISVDSLYEDLKKNLIDE